MTVAARRADVWHAWAGPAEFAAKNAVLDGLCRDIGRQPSDLARASGGTVTVVPGPGSGHQAGDDDVCGTPEQVLSQFRAFADSGAYEFIVSDDSRVPIRQALDKIDILAQAVVAGLT